MNNLNKKNKYTKNLDRLITISEVADVLGLHTNTLRNWEKENTMPFPVIKTAGRQRRYKLSHVKQYLENSNSCFEEKEEKIKPTVLYCRVSSNKQKEELDLQEKCLLQYCHQNNIYNPIIYKEIGSGMNFNRTKFNQLIKQIEFEEISTLIINYPDRLVRFGYELIEQLCDLHKVELICLNKKENKTIQEELVEDLISLVVSFSGKLYGQRSHKNKKVIESVKNAIKESEKINEKL